MRFKIVIKNSYFEEHLMNQIQRMEMINQNKTRDKNMMNKRRIGHALVGYA